MGFHIFQFLLVVLLFLSLALLGRLFWPHLQHSHAQAGGRRALVHRLLKPRTPLDCPLCRLCSSDERPASAPVRPWREMKSCRGAPKRIDTQGFACPNPKCPYFGLTDAHIHALVGDGKHGRVERIQTFRCQACRTTFSARHDTPLYRLKTPSYQVAVVLSALAEGLDPSAAQRVFGFRQATITTWLSRAGEHAHTLHERFFCHLHLPHLQLDHCCAPGCAAPHRCCGSGWPSILARSFCLCFLWVPARNTWHTCSSTPCDGAWPLAACQSSPVMASMSTSML
jgi:transposase-like protein